MDNEIDKNIGDRYGKLVIEYLHHKDKRYQKYYMCKCDCGSPKIARFSHLKAGKVSSCGCDFSEKMSKIRRDDLTGKPFGRLVVKEFSHKVGNELYWKCDCECGTKDVIVSAGALRSKHTQSCGCLQKEIASELARKRNLGKFKDLSKYKFERLKPIKIVKVKDGYAYWECLCDCGETTVVRNTYLTDGGTKSCGCLRTDELQSRREDITGKNFGTFLTATSYHGYINGRTLWNFRCVCGEDVVIDPYKVKTGHTTSCGCKHVQFCGSRGENEIRDYLVSLGTKVEQHNRTILDGKEIDLYLPDFNLGVEYNGSAFHSTVNNPFENKHKFYHRDKFVLAKEKNIHLISIFDVDWQKNSEKIKMYLKSIVVKNKKIYARKCKIVEITKEDAHKFIDKYHIQGKCYMYDTIYGLEYNGEILSMMAFGKLRMSHTDDGQYELHRYCVKDGYTVVGGANKLFAHFVKEHNAKYILSYSDNDYFLGGIYERLGFSNSGQCTPRYYWYLNEEELKRETCKLKRLKVKYPELLQEAYDVNASNKEIYVMSKLGAMQVWRSGNTKWEWGIDK